MAQEKQPKRSPCAAALKAADPRQKKFLATNADPEAVQAAEALIELSCSGSGRVKEWKEAEEPKRATVCAQVGAEKQMNDFWYKLEAGMKAEYQWWQDRCEGQRAGAN